MYFVHWKVLQSQVAVMILQQVLNNVHYISEITATPYLKVPPVLLKYLCGATLLEAGKPKSFGGISHKHFKSSGMSPGQTLSIWLLHVWLSILSNKKLPSLHLQFKPLQLSSANAAAPTGYALHSVNGQSWRTPQGKMFVPWQKTRLEPFSLTFRSFMWVAIFMKLHSDI